MNLYIKCIVYNTQSIKTRNIHSAAYDILSFFLKKAVSDNY